MLKKLLMTSSILGALLSTNAFAVMIINENTKSISYKIANAYTCTGPYYYTTGDLSVGGQIVWTETILYHPANVCVQASGWSSIIGDYVYVKNDNCIVKVVDGGFLRGIKIEKVSGC